MERKRINCPQCGRMIEYEKTGDIATFPFCSARCRFVDLDKWFEGDYRIATNVADSGDGEVFDDKAGAGRPLRGQWQGEKP